MKVIADLQLHSRFSRAVSKEMMIPNIADWAWRKGINLVATGDWTHPLWFAEIEKNLEETGNGLLKLKDDALVGSSFDSSRQGPDRLIVTKDLSAKAVTGLEKTRRPASLPLFLLATEVSSIYSQAGRVRRVHTLVWVPTLGSARKINQELTRRGCNLMSDGRPIIGLSCINLAELVLSIEPKALIIPSHAWTPWFSVYGSLGGFDSLDEAFGPFAKNIYAVETGLSSSPAMNWRIAELDNRSIVSFSDAHSGPKLGREATVFEIPEGKLSYEAIYEAIKNSGACRSSPFDSSRQDPDFSGIHRDSTVKVVTGLEKARHAAPQERSSIAYTLEFYPEEGKYHYTGHRACNIRLNPEETKQKGATCSVCGKPLTQGVMQRVEELAGRSEASLELSVVSSQLSDKVKAQMITSKAFPNRPPFVVLVPLAEIIAEAVGSPVASPKVQGPYFELTDNLGGEFKVLLEAGLTEIAKLVGERVAVGIDKVRRGDLVIDPGFDGVFGVVKLWQEGEEKPLLDSSKEQLSMF